MDPDGAGVGDGPRTSDGPPSHDLLQGHLDAEVSKGIFLAPINLYLTGVLYLPIPLSLSLSFFLSVCLTPLYRYMLWFYLSPTCFGAPCILEVT